MIWHGDVQHGALIAAAANIGFDPERNICISRVSARGEFLGGIIYTNFTGSMVMMHMAGIKNWSSPELVWLAFDYPFLQLGVKKVMCTVGSDNTRSLGIIERLGFSLEHAIEDGVPDGYLLLFSMLRENCRWLKLRSRYLKPNGHGEHVHVHA